MSRVFKPLVGFVKWWVSMGSSVSRVSKFLVGLVVGFPLKVKLLVSNPQAIRQHTAIMHRHAHIQACLCDFT